MQDLFQRFPFKFLYVKLPKDTRWLDDYLIMTVALFSLQNQWFFISLQPPKNFSFMRDQANLLDKLIS